MEKRGIELLPPVIPTTPERLVSFWVRGVGILLIITLQLLFLGLFAFRVKLGSDLGSLASSVEEKETILVEAAEFEKLFRDTQTRLEKIAEVREELCFSCAIEKLFELKPDLVTLTSLSLEGETLSLSAETPQGAYFALFITKILEEEGIREASLTSGSLNRDGNFAFALELTLNKEKIK